jgi:hypothetical protein
LCRRDHTGARPVVFSKLRNGAGINEIAGVIEAKGELGVGRLHRGEVNLIFEPLRIFNNIGFVLPNMGFFTTYSCLYAIVHLSNNRAPGVL